MNSEHVDRKTGADTELNVLYEKIMQKHNEWLYHESYLGASENVTSLKYSPFADAISLLSADKARLAKMSSAAIKIMTEEHSIDYAAKLVGPALRGLIK